MKIGIHNCAGYSAHYYINLGLARAFSSCGHEVYIWDHNTKSTFDFFDEHENLDIFIGHTYYVDDALIKCLEQRPFTKVLLKASDHGHINRHTDPNTPIVRCNKEELDKMFDLRLVVKDLLLYIHYHPDYLNFTHNGWTESGYSVQSIMNAADIIMYNNSNYMEEYNCDISYIGGHWHYKSKTLNKFLYPLCSKFNYKIKIAGNSVHPVPQYIGSIPFDLEKNFYFSSKINFCMSEPHSGKFGFDITEKPMKLSCSKGFFIADYVEGLEKLFGKSIVLVREEDNIEEIVNYYLNNEKERTRHIEEMYYKVIKSHTYFDRIYDIFKYFNMDEELPKVKEVKNQLLQSIT